jgi:hypothetical protein
MIGDGMDTLLMKLTDLTTKFCIKAKHMIVDSLTSGKKLKKKSRKVVEQSV